MKSSELFAYKLQSKLLCRVAIYLLELYNKIIMTVTPVAVYLCAVLFTLIVTTKLLLLVHASAPLEFQTEKQVGLHTNIPQTGFNGAKPARYLTEQRTCGSQPMVTPELKEAYVTLLFGNFLLGVRVLGQSLKETATTREMVVLTAEDVSDHTKDILENDGWIVKPLKELPNPYVSESETDEPNFITKLLTWQMTDYRRIVYLDADVIVVSNIDELFRCGSFCVTYRHSNLFNCGVEVIRPSTEMFVKLHEYIPFLSPESQEDDQVLLNEFYHDLHYGNLFNISETMYCENAMRLPSGYNSDIGMYYLSSRWKIPKHEIKVIHHTLGPVKPWKWWSFTLFDLNWKWQEVRRNLDFETEPGFFTPRNWIPLFVVAFIFLIWKFVSSRINQSINKLSFVKSLWNALSIYTTASKFLPLTFLAVSAYFTFKAFPETMLPHQAVASFCLWCTFFSFLLYGPYCYIAHLMGQRHSTSSSVKKLNTYLNPKLETFLWVCVSVVLLLQFYYVPFFVSPFSNRIKVFFIALAYVVVCHHFIGLRVMKIWYGHEQVTTLPCTQNL